MSADEWGTPSWLADLLGPFDLDPCSNARSHIMAHSTFALDHADPARRDGLAGEWPDRDAVFCNGPYSNPLPWCERLRDHCGPWVALWKLDPTTRWWAALMQAGPVVAPFRKRLRFKGEKEVEKAMTANFPSVLVFRRWMPPAALRPHLWLPTVATFARAA